MKYFVYYTGPDSDTILQGIFSDITEATEFANAGGGYMTIRSTDWESGPLPVYHATKDVTELCKLDELATSIASALSQKHFIRFAALMRMYESGSTDSRFEALIREQLKKKYPEVDKAFDKAEKEGTGYSI